MGLLFYTCSWGKEIGGAQGVYVQKVISYLHNFILREWRKHSLRMCIKNDFLAENKCVRTATHESYRTAKESKDVLSISMRIHTVIRGV